jgi:NAD(P)-dependent dehydrogenase (short-subunit alcohol dehydrogenase family)
MKLVGKAALITGGAKGIGRATAELFVDEGARVAIVDQDYRYGLELKKQIEDRGKELLFFEGDVSDSSFARDVFESISTQFGKLDILINNAAICLPEGEGPVSLGNWTRVLQTNLTACLEYSQLSVPLMERSDGGSIVNICSVHRLISDPTSLSYAVAKSGLYQLTRSLAIRLAQSNILVNSISPGFVRTAMSIVDGVDETSTEEFETSYLNTGRIPLGRVATPDEVATVACFLASRECPYITGSDFVVDGGLSLTI